MDIHSPFAVLYYGLIGVSSIILVGLSVLWLPHNSWARRTLKLCAMVIATFAVVWIVPKTAEMDNAAFVIINGCLGLMTFIIHTTYRDRLIDVLASARKREEDPPILQLVGNGAATLITALISWGFLFAVGMRIINS